MNIVRLVLWAMVAVAATFAGYQFLNKGQSGIGGQQSAALGGPFNLVTNSGATITQQDILGRPHAIFFGFTNCPDVCPTTLYETAGWMKEMGEDADKIDFYFFSVDPERDTPEVLNEYVNAFDPRITAVTGDPEEMAKTIRSYKAYSNRVELGEGDYTMDHSAFVMLLRPDGSFMGTISYGENNETAVAKLRRLMKTG